MIALVAAVLFSAGSLSATTLAEAPPPDLAPAVRALLAPAGARVTSAGTTLDFWFVKSLPLQAGAAPSWQQAEEGTIVGAVRVSAVYRDIRGRTIKPGSYTLRYGIQPANGDHLGVSPFREFLLLSPAAADTDVKPTGHEGSVELSKQTIGGSHPAVWSLDPPALSEGAAPLSTRTNDAGHEAIVFEVPTSSGTPLRFGLILVGKIDA
ncbi:MAG TPA: hypothetical protein VHJ77_14955 [Vicinamibacterales bacterium]|nr:hypothetical protein [Vicinamibacterales bacterium]